MKVPEKIHSLLGTVFNQYEEEIRDRQNYLLLDEEGELVAEMLNEACASGMTGPFISERYLESRWVISLMTEAVDNWSHWDSCYKEACALFYDWLVNKSFLSKYFPEQSIDTMMENKCLLLYLGENDSRMIGLALKSLRFPYENQEDTLRAYHHHTEWGLDYELGLGCEIHHKKGNVSIIRPRRYGHTFLDMIAEAEDVYSVVSGNMEPLGESWIESKGYTGTQDRTCLRDKFDCLTDLKRADIPKEQRAVAVNPFSGEPVYDTTYRMEDVVNYLNKSYAKYKGAL